MNKNVRSLMFTTAIFFIICVVLILSLIFDQNKSTSNSASPTPSSPPTTQPNQVYAPGSIDNLLQKMENRQQLSTADLTIRNSIIASLNNQSGTLFSNGDYNIAYIKPADMFQVEITTTNTNQAKKEADGWFLSKGFDQNGICNLPIMFYLSFPILNQLRGSNLNFNQLPDGC